MILLLDIIIISAIILIIYNYPKEKYVKRLPIRITHQQRQEIIDFESSLIKPISHRNIQNFIEEPSIIVKDPYFNVNKIKEYITEEEPKKFIFRPRSLVEYIGQEKAKALIRLNLEKIRKLKFVHFLISGHRGCGKSTLAYILKNELNAKMIERIAGEFSNPDQIIDVINEINSSKEDYIILFIDELHALKPQLCESFYPIMEDFKIAGKKIKPFVMIGATTEKNVLMNKVAPMVDRFQVQVELEKYTEEDIIKIIKQYKEQLFPDKTISEENYQIIAQNCKFTPRIAITLLEDNLIEKSIEKILNCHKIIKEGLTNIDVKILSLLAENEKAIGEKAIAMATGISTADYNALYEPYLCEKQYLIRTSRGRIIGKKGKEILKILKKEEKDDSSS